MKQNFSEADDPTQCLKIILGLVLKRKMQHNKIHKKKILRMMIHESHDSFILHYRFTQNVTKLKYMLFHSNLVHVCFLPKHNTLKNYIMNFVWNLIIHKYMPFLFSQSIFSRVIRKFD